MNKLRATSVFLFAVRCAAKSWITDWTEYEIPAAPGQRTGVTRCGGYLNIDVEPPERLHGIITMRQRSTSIMSGQVIQRKRWILRCLSGALLKEKAFTTALKL